MMKTGSKLELVSSGVRRGNIDVTNDELAEREWGKYSTDGGLIGEKRRTSAEDIYDRLGVRVRPRVSAGQTHASMFNDAYDQALANAEERGFDDIRGNVISIYAASCLPSERVPEFLPEVVEHVTLGKLGVGLIGNYFMRACAGFNHGVNVLRESVSDESFEGYGVVGASEIWGDSWLEDNFDSLLFGEMAAVAIFKISDGSDEILSGVNRFTESGDIVRREDGLLYMDGREVMKTVPGATLDLCQKSLEMNGLELRDIDRFILHPGSKHVLRHTLHKFRRAYGEGFDESMVPDYLEDCGNCGAATTPNALHRQIQEGAIKNGDTVYVGAMGMGYHEAGFMINGFNNL